METVRLQRVKKFNPMWKPNKELEAIYNREIFQFINISGRVGGKTYNMVQLICMTALDKPNLDVVVLRANSSQLKQSVYLELKKFFYKILPLDKFAKINFRESPPLMITLPAGNQIIFGGVGLGSKSGANQSRGKTSERKLSLIIVEETQEIFSGSADGQELLKQAIATYIRELDIEDGKIIFLGNRDRNKNGKFNVWVKEREKDNTFLIIETNWHDIESLLTRPTIAMIEQERELNPNNYKYMYLGIPVGGDQLVYGAFTQSVHLMPKKEVINKNYDIFVDMNTKDEYEFSKEFLLKHLRGVLFGVDGSTVQDMTVLMPIFVFDTGKMVLKCGNIFQHNPKMNGQITNIDLVNNYIRKWLHKLIDKYMLQYKNKIFIVDGHNTDLIRNLRSAFGGYANVIGFTKKDLVETTNMVNNAFSMKKLLLTDENWIEQVSNNEIPIYDLLNELETVCWREDDSTKFNDAIPNDRTDGIRYPVSWYAKPQNLLSNIKAV